MGFGAKWAVYLFPKTDLRSCNLRECGGEYCKFVVTIRINKVYRMTTAIPSSESNLSLTGADLEGLFWLRNEGAGKPLATACRNLKFLFRKLDCPGGATLWFIFICQYLKLPVYLFSVQWCFVCPVFGSLVFLIVGRRRAWTHTDCGTTALMLSKNSASWMGFLIAGFIVSWLDTICFGGLPILTFLWRRGKQQHL